MRNVRDIINFQCTQQLLVVFEHVVGPVVWDRTNLAIRRELGLQISSLVSELTQYQLKKHK